MIVQIILPVQIDLFIHIDNIVAFLVDEEAIAAAFPVFHEAADLTAAQQDHGAQHRGGMRHQPHFLLLSLSGHPGAHRGDHHGIRRPPHSKISAHRFFGGMRGYGDGINALAQKGHSAYFQFRQPRCL